MNLCAQQETPEDGAARIVQATRNGTYTITGLAVRVGLNHKTVAYHAQHLERLGHVRRSVWGRETLVHDPHLSREAAVVRRILQESHNRRMLHALLSSSIRPVLLGQAGSVNRSTALRFLHNLERLALVRRRGTHYEATPRLRQLTRRLSEPA